MQATAEANNLAAVADAKSTYTQLMEEVCGGQKPYLSEGHLEAEHLRVRDKAIFQVYIIFNYFIPNSDKEKLAKTISVSLIFTVYIKKETGWR